MIRVGVALILTTLLASPLSAAPDRSPRPEPRPTPTAIVKTPDGFVQFVPSARTPSGRIAVFFGGGTRPEPRPVRRAPRETVATQITRPPATPAQMGAVCGRRDIRGRTIASIPGRLPGCGVRSPVQITEVAGVRLSQGASITCETAQALSTWVERGLKPAVGRMGGGVESLRVVAHYSCRTRNNKTGAKISEHGKGKAIDIAAIRLKNGDSLSVLNDWNTRRKGRVLKQAHKAACGPFGTVLGPNADRYHRDHFHFDTASYRSGPYCR